MCAHCNLQWAVFSKQNNTAPPAGRHDLSAKYVITVDWWQNIWMQVNATVIWWSCTESRRYVQGITATDKKMIPTSLLLFIYYSLRVVHRLLFLILNYYYYYYRQSASYFHILLLQIVGQHFKYSSIEKRGSMNIWAHMYFESNPLKQLRCVWVSR